MTTIGVTWELLPLQALVQALVQARRRVLVAQRSTLSTRTSLARRSTRCR
jgi:hypothetical protein